MATNISIFGIAAQIVASASFPNGFTLTEFADDADPLDSPDLEVAESAMGVNGDFITWSRPQGIEVTLNVIPSSQGDTNLGVVLMANRVGKGKVSARDSIRMVIAYPDGSNATLTDGIMVSGPPLTQGSSGGRSKTKQYRFRFSTIVKSTHTTAA